MRDDHFTSTEADAGRYERQRAQDDYDPPDVSLGDDTDGDCPTHHRLEYDADCTCEAP